MMKHGCAPFRAKEIDVASFRHPTDASKHPLMREVIALINKGTPWEDVKKLLPPGITKEYVVERLSALGLIWIDGFAMSEAEKKLAINRAQKYSPTEESYFTELELLEKDQKICTDGVVEVMTTSPYEYKEMIDPSNLDMVNMDLIEEQSGWFVKNIDDEVLFVCKASIDTSGVL